MAVIIRHYQYKQSSKYFSKHTSLEVYCNLREIPYEGKKYSQKSFYFCLKLEAISEEKLYLKIGRSIVGLLKEEVGYMPFQDL